MTTFVLDDAVEPAHLVLHFVGAGAAKAENEALAKMVADIGGRERPKPKAFPGGAGGDFAVGQAGGQSENEVHTGLGAEDLKIGAELSAEGVRKGVTPLHIQLAGFADVAREMTSANEVRQSGLVQERGREIVGLADCHKAVDQRGRKDHVSESEGREKHFTEGADVEDT